MVSVYRASTFGIVEQVERANTEVVAAFSGTMLKFVPIAASLQNMGPESWL
jgi:hypothetical protein